MLEKIKSNGFKRASVEIKITRNQITKDRGEDEIVSIEALHYPSLGIRIRTVKGFKVTIKLNSKANYCLFSDLVNANIMRLMDQGYASKWLRISSPKNIPGTDLKWGDWLDKEELEHLEKPEPSKPKTTQELLEEMKEVLDGLENRIKRVERMWE